MNLKINPYEVSNMNNHEKKLNKMNKTSEICGILEGLTFMSLKSLERWKISAEIHTEKKMLKILEAEGYKCIGANFKEDKTRENYDYNILSHC